MIASWQGWSRAGQAQIARPLQQCEKARGGRTEGKAEHGGSEDDGAANENNTAAEVDQGKSIMQGLCNALVADGAYRAIVSGLSTGLRHVWY
jgi:hypothetical protein